MIIQIGCVNIIHVYSSMYTVFRNIENITHCEDITVFFLSIGSHLNAPMNNLYT